MARAAVLPFVAFYSAFDAIVGFATGLLVTRDRYVDDEIRVPDAASPRG